MVEYQGSWDQQQVDRYVDDEYDTFRNWLLGRGVQEVQISLEPEKYTAGITPTACREFLSN